jgi:hypothetical protein
MAAKKKSASRRSAAKAKRKTARKRPATKKGAAKKKAVGKRASARKKAAAAPRRKSAAKAGAVRRPKALPSPDLMEIDQRIALIRNNLRDLSEQAASTSGSASEEALSDRITSQEAELQRLSAERDALVKGEGG